MHNIIFHFYINQPKRLQKYRFFDINSKRNYFDEFQNNYLIKRLSERCYLKTNSLFKNLIQKYGDKATFSFSISGTTIELFEKYDQSSLESFQKLINTDNIELISSTYSNSLASLYEKECFLEQIAKEEEILNRLFNKQLTSFANSNFIYSDEIGEWIAERQYKNVLTEGAKHILGWKNSGFLYCNPYKTDLKLLLRNSSLSDDISIRFNNKSWDQYPLTAEKYFNFLNNTPEDVPLINIFLDYELFGEQMPEESGIFAFFEKLIELIVASDNFNLITPNKIDSLDLAVSTVHVPWAISTSGEEKDTSEWLGNELQQESFNKLFSLEKEYKLSSNKEAKQCWLELQAADYFNFMGTKWLQQDSVKRNFEVYASPYEAFINYMNILSDIKIQLEK